MRVPHVRLRAMLLEGLIAVVAWGGCLGFEAWRVTGRALKWLKVMGPERGWAGTRANPAMNKPLLFVVAQGDMTRRGHVRHLFGTRAEVEIVSDRRLRGRRAHGGAHVGQIERRRRERRSHDVSRDLLQSGWAYVGYGEGEGTGRFRRLGRLIDRPAYDYYSSSAPPQTLKHQHQAAELSAEILNPSLRNPQYLALRARRRIVTRWVENLPTTGLQVLDVGGRLQPYRPLLAGRITRYTAIDPVLEGLLNVVAVGEQLPFPSERFDVVICTQVLNYVTNPFQVIAECYRVLRPRGALILSLPVWRLMPEELTVLLAPFSCAEIVSEDHSVAGLFSVFNLVLDTVLFDTQGWRARKLLSSVVFPATNLAGLALGTVCRNRRFTTNYSSLAFK